MLLRPTTPCRPHTTLVGLALACALAAAGAGCRAEPEETAATRADESPPEAERGLNVPPASTGGLLAEEPPEDDPDYPTPAAAGTEAIFFLEEPDRGPWITTRERPTELTEDDARWRWHATCETSPGDLVCGAALETRPRAGWRVADVDGTTVADEVRSDVVVATWLFERSADGDLERVVELDAFGEVVMARSFSPLDERYTARVRDGSNALPGCGSLALTRDDKGRATIATCVSWLDEPMKNLEGVVTTAFERDPETGLVRAERHLDASGAPAQAHDGVHRRVTTRDDHGRPTAIAAFGLDGAPALDARSGCATKTLRYDAGGLLVEDGCLGVDGAPASGAGGLTGKRYLHGPRGCVVRDEREGTTLVRAHTYEVGARCEVLVERCFGVDEAPVACVPERAHELRTTRDARGRVTARRGAGPDGAGVALLAFEAVEERYELDAHGRTVTIACHAADGAPAACGALGFHAKHTTYDDAGREIEATFTAADGRRANNLGTWKRRTTWDAYDHRREVTYLDAAGAPTETLGASRARYVYDAGHRLFGMLLFGNDGEPATYRGCYTSRRCPSEPWHAVRIERAPSGRVETNLFFGPDRRRLGSLDCDDGLCWR